MANLQLTSVGNNVLRDQHYALNNATGAYERCTLLEGAMTNVVTDPSDLTKASWTLTNGTAALNATGPNGVANAGSTLTATSTSCSAGCAGASLTAGSKQTVSVYLRAGTAAYIYIKDTGDAGAHAAWIRTSDMTAGTLTNMTVQWIVPMANGEYRVMLNYTATNSYTGALLVGFSDTDNSTTCTSGVTGQFYGLQQAANAAVGSSFLAGARSADVAYVDLSGTALAIPREATFYVKFIELGTLQFPLSLRVFQIGDGSTAGTNTLALLNGGGGKYQVAWYNASSASTALAVAGAALNDQVEVLVYVSADGKVHLTQAINGVAAATADSATAQAFGSSFSSTRCYLNSKDATPTSAGLLGLQAFKAIPGNYTLAQMRGM